MTIVPIVVGMVLLGVPRALAGNDLPSQIRVLCSGRWPDDDQKMAECAGRQSVAARGLLNLLEDVDRGSTVYVIAQKCIERSRLQKYQKTKTQNAPIDWAQAKKCVTARLEKQAGPE